MNKMEISFTKGEMGKVDKAPDVQTVSTEFKKIIIARLRCGTDVLEGLQNVVKENNIKNAVIITGIGSLTGTIMILEFLILMESIESSAKFWTADMNPEKIIGFIPSPTISFDLTER